VLLEGKRIFVVEDNVENRIVYQLIFVREGASCDFERWGPQAVERLKHFKPVDLIILDLALARGVTGYGIYSEIRALPEFDGVPILAVSATDAAQAIPKTRAQGFSGYIAKPIKQTKFAEQLKRVIDGEAIWDEG
jgi:two-component system, cell cycle response regulator DivK